LLYYHTEQAQCLLFFNTIKEDKVNLAIPICQDENKFDPQ